MRCIFSVPKSIIKRNFLVMLIIFFSIFSGCKQSFSPSKEELFNADWQFTISDASFEGIQKNEKWENVSLPHTPVIEPKVMNGQWQGICWYRKTFQLAPQKETKRYVLRFDGAMNASEFWINGTKIASHQGGYLPVVFDFTDVANVGGENEILVRLDNTDNKITGPKPMKTLDFNMYGGLYRNAFLSIENSVHISYPILANKVAGGGIFVSFPEVSKDKAIVQVKANVINQSGKESPVEVKNELWRNGQMVLSFDTERQTIAAGKDADFIVQMPVENPELWSPQSPNLYELKTIISNGKNIVDTETTRIGIRRIEITREAFKINRQKMFLRGVNRHQDYPYVGYALSDNAQYRDAVKIKEAGFDYVRVSHYPHSPAFMDACDELGLVVLDAILGWQYYSTDSLFQQHVFKTAHDLIRRDRNHPCVIGWEVSLNESWMDEPFIDELHKIAHAEYPGDQCYSAGWQKYGYDIFLQARQHRQGHYSDPEKPYVVSEYGDWEYYAMNAGLNQDDWGNLLQDERSSRQLLSNGEVRLLQQATNVQEAHNDNFNTPAFADGYWVMFDYNRGYSDDLEASGIMSIDRLPKYSYYFYQSQRGADEISDKYQSGPMVHIASWWTPESPLNVRIFSNCEKVELFLNGKSLGKQKPDQNSISNNLAHPPFTFHLAKFEAEELSAKAYINGNVVAEHSVKTPGELAKINLKLDDSRKKVTAGCNDVLFVHATLEDESGTVIRKKDVPVLFSIEGDAELVSPAEIPTEAGIASALIRFGDLTKPVLITVKSKDEKLKQQITVFPEK